MEPVLTSTVVPKDVGHRARVVNRYAMPFALIVVLLGVVLGNPVGRAAYISIALLVFGAVFNLWSAGHIARAAKPAAFINLRLWVNVFANAALVWVLGSVWSPCWLLLALTPLASGVYGSRSRTLSLAVVVSAILLLRYFAQAHVSPIELGEQLTYCAFIILASLMVAELTRPGASAA